MDYRLVWVVINVIYSANIRRVVGNSFVKQDQIEFGNKYVSGDQIYWMSSLSFIPDGGELICVINTYPLKCDIINSLEDRDT